MSKLSHSELRKEITDSCKTAAIKAGTYEADMQCRWEIFLKHLEEKRLTQEELTGSTITLVKKGDLLNKDSYTRQLSNDEEREEQYIKDGACLIETSIQTTDGKQEIVKKCKKDSKTNEFTPSEEEMLCIKIKRNDDEIINDFSNDTSLSQRPLCKYFQND